VYEGIASILIILLFPLSKLHFNVLLIQIEFELFSTNVNDGGIYKTIYYP
jgi:hypothetical protein